MRLYYEISTLMTYCTQEVLRSALTGFSSH